MMRLIFALPKALIVFIVLVLLGVIVVVLAINKGGGKPTKQDLALPSIIPSPKIILPPDVKKAKLRNITYTLPSVTLPKELPVYKVTAYAVDRAWAEDVAKTFAIANTPEISLDVEDNTVLRWKSEGNNQFLRITLNTGYVEYTDVTPQFKADLGSSPEPTIGQANQAASTAQDFLKNHALLAPQLVPNIGAIQYFKTGESNQLQETRNFSDANLYIVPFVRKISGHSVYQQYGVAAQATVSVAKDKTIRKATFAYPLVSEQTAKTLPLLNLDQAKTKLDTGGGTIVNFTPGVIDKKAVTDPSSVTITRVSVDYFDDQATGVLTPIFVFEGTASYGLTTADDQPVIIYLPALQ